MEIFSKYMLYVCVLIYTYIMYTKTFILNVIQSFFENVKMQKVSCKE